MHTSPTQKTGKEIPTRAPSMTKRSAKVPWRTAEMTPSGTPASTAMTMPLTASAADQRRLDSTSPNAGCPVTTELPRSPVRARATKPVCGYCGTSSEYCGNEEVSTLCPVALVPLK